MEKFAEGASAGSSTRELLLATMPKTETTGTLVSADAAPESESFAEAKAEFENYVEKTKSDIPFEVWAKANGIKMPAPTEGDDKK